MANDMESVDRSSTFSVSASTAKITLVVLSTSLVSLLVAAVALVIYDRLAVREEMVTNRALLAELIGSNSVTALEFDDARVGGGAGVWDPGRCGGASGNIAVANGAVDPRGRLGGND